MWHRTKRPFVKQAYRVYKTLLWLRSTDHGCKRKTNYQLLFPSSHTNRRTGMHAHLITIRTIKFSTEKKPFSHYTSRLFETWKLCCSGGGMHLSLSSTDFPIFHHTCQTFGNCGCMQSEQWVCSLPLLVVASKSERAFRNTGPGTNPSPSNSPTHIQSNGSHRGVSSDVSLLALHI